MTSQPSGPGKTRARFFRSRAPRIAANAPCHHREPHILSLVASDGRLFWFDEDDQGTSVLRSAAQDGTDGLTLVEANRALSGPDLVADSTAIFWNNSPEVLMLAR